jgi:hypothetical protein
MYNITWKIEKKTIMCGNITLLGTHRLLSGPSEYNSRMLKKAKQETQLSKHPTVIFQGLTEPTVGAE